MTRLHVPHTAWIMTAEGWREITIDRPEARQFVDPRGPVNDWPKVIDWGVFEEGQEPRARIGQRRRSLLFELPRRNGKSIWAQELAKLGWKFQP
jgi:hypothetical protein